MTRPWDAARLAEVRAHADLDLRSARTTSYLIQARINLTEALDEIERLQALLAQHDGHRPVLQTFGIGDQTELEKVPSRFASGAADPQRLEDGLRLGGNDRLDRCRADAGSAGEVLGSDHHDAEPTPDRGTEIEDMKEVSKLRARDDGLAADLAAAVVRATAEESRWARAETEVDRLRARVAEIEGFLWHRRQTREAARG